MHAEILSAAFPPQYPHGQFMPHKGPYNQRTDQLDPPLHTIHKDFSSYQPAFSTGHFGDVQPKGSVPVQYLEKQVFATDVVDAAHQPPTRYEDCAHDFPNGFHQFPNPPNPPAHTDCGQSHFSFGHADAGRLQTSVPVVVPEPQPFPEIIVLEHSGAEPHEHAGSYPSNHHHHHNRSDCENIPVETAATATGFDHRQHLNHPPIPSVIPENEIIVLGHDTESYEHAGTYPPDHLRQRLDCENIPVETTPMSFDQCQPLDRSRSQTPRPVMVPESEVVMLDTGGTDSYGHTGNYPSDHHRQRSECEKIPVETELNFDQYQQLNRSRSHSPLRTVASDPYVERHDAVPLRREELSSYGQGADFASTGHQCLNPANSTTHQPHVGVNHHPTPTRDEGQQQTPIISEPVLYPPPTPGFRVIPEPQPDFYLLQHDPMTDEEAAASVYDHFSQRKDNPQQTKAEQELSRLILSSPFMTGCLGEVVHWANILFFKEKLTVTKVNLQWSDPADPRFDLNSGGLIGTTELKPDHTGGFQTRIILSRQRLMSGTYDQRLVLSAILHECVHAYLFICRGFEATEDGGHTKGFRDIARLIDRWVDDDGSYLRLQCQEADLEKFKTSAGHGWNCQRATWGQDNGFLWTSSRL